MDFEYFHTKLISVIAGQGNPFRARPLKRGKNKLQMKIPP